MKPVTPIIAVATAAAAAMGSLVAAEKCAKTTLSFAFIPIELKSQQCADESGYVLLPFDSMPTQNETHAMCKSDVCKEMLRSADVPDCTTLVDGEAGNVKEKFRLMRASCLVAEVNSLST